MKDNAVQTVDAEVVSIETVITTELEKANITEAIIAKLKENYFGLTINGQDDREGYNAVKEARKDCKSWRVRAEKICKKGREDAVSIQKAWVAKEKEVAGKIGEIEDYLETQEKAYEAEKERIKAELKAKHDNQFATRTIELTKMGAAFDGTNFTLEDVSYESVLIREADDDVYAETILPKYKAIFDKNEEIRLAELKAKEEAEAAQKAEREEFERQQAELKQQQEALLKQQQEADRLKAEEEEKKKQAERDRVTALQNQRLTELLPFNPTGADVNMNALWELSDEDYNKVLETKKAAFKQQEEEKRKKMEEDAAIMAREKLAEEQRQAELRKQQEEQRKAEELEKASDKEKWAVFIKEIEKLQMPAVTGGYFKNKVKLAKEKVNEIISL